MHRLYYSPGACSMAAHIVLEEIGEPYDLELVSSRGRDGGEGTTSPAWMAQNPKGRVPALSGVSGRIGGSDHLLTELHAILFYLARTHPQARLLPTDPAGEARAIEWMNWLASNVHAMSYGQIWRANRFVADEDDFAAVQNKGLQNLREQYAYIERVLDDGRQWALPGGYSVVDPYLLVFYQWGGQKQSPIRSGAFSGQVRRARKSPPVRAGFIGVVRVVAGSRAGHGNHRRLLGHLTGRPMDEDRKPRPSRRAFCCTVPEETLGRRVVYHYMIALGTKADPWQHA